MNQSVNKVEDIAAWREAYRRWLRMNHGGARTNLVDYPFLSHKRTPFVPVRRALPMLNLALITSAGAYIDGTEPFDVNAAGGDLTFREIPTQVEAEDFKFAARGYNPKAVEEDMNSQVPLARLREFESNGIIGQLNSVFFSLCGYIPDAGRLVDETLPQLVERVKRYEVQAALLVPASRLCHQTMGLAARALETAGVPTMMLAVEREITDIVHPPRAAYYNGEFGSVAGRPNWKEHQRRILDESLRLLEPTDQVGVRKLTVDLETTVEMSRGER